MYLKINKIFQTVLFELSWLNLLLMFKLKTFRIPLIVFKSVHFRMERTAKIKNTTGGRLQLGKKWDISRFMQSEMKICDRGVLEIRGNMRIYTGCSIDICPDATVSLGSGYINNGVRIAAFKKIYIGDNVVISENVTLRDSDNHKILGTIKPQTSPIVIGDNVWIGMNCLILKGVTIGDNSIIGAGSIVTNNIPNNVIAGGNPAIVIKNLGPDCI